MDSYLLKKRIERESAYFLPRQQINFMDHLATAFGLNNYTRILDIVDI